MRTSLLFFRRNFYKYKSIILSLVMFLILFNVIFGFVYAITNNFKSSVVNNSDLYFMEIYTDGGNKILTNELKDEVAKVSGVDATFCEYPNVVVIYGNEKSEGTSTTLLGVPFDSLKYFGVKNTSDSEKEFFYINSNIRNAEKLKDSKDINIETARYVVNNNNVTSEPYTFKRKVNEIADISSIQMFPPDISLIDEKTATELAKSSTIDGKPVISRIIVIVSDVSKMKSVSASIEKLDSRISTRYTLKSTRQLPQFAVIIVTMSAFFFVLLFIISILSIRSNIKQLLVTRTRDIALFDILGVETNKITFVFLVEFILSGILAFTASIAITAIIMAFIKFMYSLDLISNYISYYLIIDSLLTIIMVIITSYFEIKIAQRDLTNKNNYKEAMH